LILFALQVSQFGAPFFVQGKKNSGKLGCMESFVLLQDIRGIALRVFHFEQISRCLSVLSSAAVYLHFTQDQDVLLVIC
jgi:hypothetical protein